MTDPAPTPARPPDLSDPAIHLPATFDKNDARVRSGFWRKVLRVFAAIPFIDDLLAAYFCATDKATPVRVRGVLLAALAYFVLPLDVVPDFIAGFGFSDDATVLATAVATVSRHITPAHRELARQTLDAMRGRAHRA